MYRTFRCIAITTLVLSLLYTSSHAVTLSLTEQMNLTTMMETSLSTFRMLQEARGYDYGVPVGWTGTFSATGWSYQMIGTLLGDQLDLSMSGKLSGDPDSGDTIHVEFTGSGTWGNGSISTEGFTEWYYDAQEQGYTHMYYEDSGELIGSWWKWVVRGAEILAGVGTGGATKSWKVGVTVGTAAWTISDMVFEVVSPPKKPNPPKPQPPPPTTSPDDRKYQVIVINGSNNTINKNWGPTRGGGVIDDKTKTVTGQSQSVPEPSALFLFASGLASVAGVLRKYKK